MTDIINIRWILRHIVIWVPAVCIMVIIFNFSSMVADDSSNTSIPIAEVVIQKIEQTMDISINNGSESYGLIHHLVRKAGHFLEYMALGCTLVLPFAFIFIRLKCYYQVSYLLHFMHVQMNSTRLLYLEGMGILQMWELTAWVHWPEYVQVLYFGGLVKK